MVLVPVYQLFHPVRSTPSGWLKLDLAILVSFGVLYTFRVVQTDRCIVTVYGSNNTNCGNGYKFPLQLNQCYNDASISQFSIDADSPGEIVSSSSAETIQTSGLTTSSIVPSKSTGTSTQALATTSPTSTTSSTEPTSTSRSNGGNLTTTGIIGLSVGLPPFAILVLVFAVSYYCFWHKKSSVDSSHQYGPATVSGHGTAFFGNFYNHGPDFMQQVTHRWSVTDRCHTCYTIHVL